jgi:hypothetical protein
MTVQIPANLEEVTPEWFTQVLIDSGVIKHTSVTAVESERLGEGQGFIGQVIRFKLTYRIFEKGTPQSIIAKISHSDPERRKRISDSGFYKMEISFYKEIADKIDLRTPYCYCSSIDEETGLSVLLLEDLQDGRIGDNLSGCSHQEAEHIIERLASFHAAWWENPELESMDWIRTQPLLDDPDVKEGWQQAMNDSWCHFTEKFAGRIPTPVKEAWPLFVQYGDQIRRQALVPPLTLCHGDYRLDNFFFGPAKENSSLVVFDWQTLIRAQGTLDLSYFIIWSLEPELRRKVEKDLLHKYCAELKKHGVVGYSPEQCFHNYQITLYDLILMRQVRMIAVSDVSSDRAQALFSVLLARTSEAIVDYPIVNLI